MQAPLDRKGPTTAAAGMNLLVLLIGDSSPDRLHDELSSRPEAPERIHVVAPAVVGPLDWLASADDNARLRAEARALATEWTLAETGEVDAEAGDVDPVQAVEDALRSFPADEILIAGDAADPDLEAALRRFGLPVSRLDRLPSGHSTVYRALRSLAGGRSWTTPFILFVGVNAAFMAFALLLSLVVVLVLWLVGVF